MFITIFTGAVIDSIQAYYTGTMLGDYLFPRENLGVTLNSISAIIGVNQLVVCYTLRNIKKAVDKKYPM